MATTHVAMVIIMNIHGNVTGDNTGFFSYGKKKKN